MSLMLVPFGLAKLGWFSGLHQAVGPQMFRLTGLEELSIWWILAGFTMNLINIVAQPHTMEVCSTGKTEFEGRIGFTYGNFIKRFCAIGWAVTGVIVAGLVAKGMIGPVVREDAFGTAIRVLLPAGFGLVGLMFAAILAAQMSTLSAFMVAASALVSRNVYKKYVNPAADEAHMLRVARFGGLIIVFLGVIFALKVGGVADALVWFWTLATFTGLFMWAGVLWRRTNATGAWASFFVMLAIWLVIGEPGQAVGQYQAKKGYSPASPAAISRMTEGAKSLDRFLLEVQSVKGGKTEQKNVIVQLSGNHPQLGLALRESAAGSPVVSVGEKGAAKQAGIKEGDVLLRQAQMSWLGIFADKKLLHYRLLAFLPAGILALIIGSLLGKPHPKDKLDKFYTLIKTPVGRESELVEQGIDVVYAGQSKGHPWELNHQRAVNVIGFLIALVLSGLFFLLLYGLTRLGG
jgi:SSS family solute:Na+ symporter